VSFSILWHLELERSLVLLYIFELNTEIAFLNNEI